MLAALRRMMVEENASAEATFQRDFFMSDTGQKVTTTVTVTRPGVEESDARVRVERAMEDYLIKSIGVYQAMLGDLRAKGINWR